jgi:hypothetical protein
LNQTSNEGESQENKNREKKRRENTREIAGEENSERQGKRE